MNKKCLNKGYYVFRYGGPTHIVMNWASNLDKRNFYAAVLTSSLQVVYGFIDGRGTPYKGIDMLHSIHRKFGTYETYDQINVTR